MVPHGKKGGKREAKEQKLQLYAGLSKQHLIKEPKSNIEYKVIKLVGYNMEIHMNLIPPAELKEQHQKNDPWRKKLLTQYKALV